MRGKLGDKVRLNHILEAIIEIESYLNDADFDTFMENSMIRFACVKQMEIVGEASYFHNWDFKLRPFQLIHGLP